MNALREMSEVYWSVMSQLGNLKGKVLSRTFDLPNPVTVKLKEGRLAYDSEGIRKGSHHVPKEVSIEVSLEQLKITSQNKMMFGTTVSLVTNWLLGLMEGYRFEVEVIGVGYWVKKEGQELIFKVGYTHLVRKEVDVDVSVQLLGNRRLILTSWDKEKLGQVIGELEKIKKKSPYRQSGIYVIGKTYLSKKGSKG